MGDKKKKKVSVRDSGQDSPPAPAGSHVYDEPPGSPFARNNMLHPHGGKDSHTSDVSQMLNQLQQNRMETIKETKSPFVRRDISGRVVGENEPSGVDALRDIPHSWDTTEQRPNPSVYGGFAEKMRAERPSPFDIKRGENVTAAMGPHGGGYAPVPGHTFNEIPTSKYNDGLGDLGQQLTPDGKRQLGLNTQLAYGDAVMNPKMSPFERRLASATPSTYDSGRGPDASNQPAQLFQLPPAEVAGEGSDFTPNTSGADMSGSATHINPTAWLTQGQGALPTFGRQAVDFGANAIDALLARFIDPSLAGYVRNLATPYIGEQQYPQMTDPFAQAQMR